MKTMRHKGKRLLHRPEDRKGRRLLAGVLCVCLLLPNLEHFVRGLDPAAEGLCEHTRSMMSFAAMRRSGRRSPVGISMTGNAASGKPQMAAPAAICMMSFAVMCPG